MDTLYWREILDTCGLSAEYCRKCAADEMRHHATVGVAEQAKTESQDAAKRLVRTYLENARSKVGAVAKALESGTQTLDGAAKELELEARIWGQDLHNAILEEAALEGLPPEQFEKRAEESAHEIVAMAADEFSVMCGRDTVDRVTPVLIGRTPAVVTSDQPPRVYTRASIIQYLEKALAEYPQQYRQQNLSVYKLTRGTDPVPDPASAPPDDQVAKQQRQAALAAARQAVVSPILRKKTWKRGKWATKAGVSKNSVYEYLKGKRNLTRHCAFPMSPRCARKQSRGTRRRQPGESASARKRPANLSTCRCLRR